jgi:hypothetical protein
MQGKRVHAVQTDQGGAIRFAEGEYGLHETRGWCGRPPGLDHAIDLSGHEVEEHPDLTITVKGVIHAGGPLGSNGPIYHGELIRGEWIDETLF